MDTKRSYYFSQKRLEMLEFLPNTSKIFLDAGCGEGNFASELKNITNSEIWGIEIDDNSYKIAKTKIDNILLGSIEDNISKLPDNYFDCIIFNDSLEHLVDPYSVLEKIKVKLKKESSYIVASIPNVRYFSNLRRLIINKDWEYTDSGILDKTHLRFFTKKSIIRMFNDLGFEIIKIKGINPIKSKRFDVLNFVLFNILEDCRYLQYACVVKPK